MLFNAGADIQATDKHDHTLLAYLIDSDKNQHIAILIKLLSAQQQIHALRKMIESKVEKHFIKQLLMHMKGTDSLLTHLFYQQLRECDDQFGIDVLQLIINAGFHIDCEDSRFLEATSYLLPPNGKTPHDTHMKLEFLLKNDVDPFSCTIQPTVFERLISAGMQDKVFNELIECLNPPKESVTKEAMLLTAEYVNPTALSVLVANGGNVGILDEHGNTILHIISSKKPIPETNKYLEILHDHNLNFGAQNEDGETAAHLAVTSNNTEFLTLFATYCDIDTKNLIGDTPLLHAIRQPSCIESTKTLIELGANKNVYDCEGYSTMHIAIHTHVEDFSDYAKFFDPNQLTKETQDTPLMVACSVQNLHAIDYLLDIDSVDMYQQNTTGDNVFHKAVQTNSLPVLHKLMKYKPYLNCKNHKQETALHIAAEHGHYEFCKILLRGHADVNAKNERGETPLMIATHHGKQEVVAVLLDQQKQDTQII
jgi:ankyrin repeat protein